MKINSNTLLIWQQSLTKLLRVYETHRGPVFYLSLFLFFICLNIICYWLAMFSAHYHLINSAQFMHYFRIQFPVGILGAIFDSLSFFITIFIIRRALKSNNIWNFCTHLSVDLLIAIAATFWVVFVFSISGYLVSYYEQDYTSLSFRKQLYQAKVVNAIHDPTNNLRNIYFGIVMGISSMIPTCIHCYMAIRSIFLARK